jgi:hypothetical protein
MTVGAEWRVVQRAAPDDSAARGTGRDVTLAIERAKRHVSRRELPPFRDDAITQRRCAATQRGHGTGQCAGLENMSS